MSRWSALGEPVARLALAHLPKLGPARGRWLLSGPEPPGAVLEALARGALPPGIGPAPPQMTAAVVAGWEQALRGIDPLERWAAHEAADLTLLTPGHRAWPFGDDPEPPLILWARGRVELLGRRPAAAIVGSRRCTAIGARVAGALGAGLAAAGVAVVSGLAAGIDAAAHRAVVAAGGDAVAVVATGADVVYPPSSAHLWSQVAEVGVVVGEAPLGVGGQRWRFPARNRLVAGLAQAVVVVESHARGGALHTVTEAERRQVPVLAVPGSVLSPASAGTNQLLFDGAGVARDALDVLGVLGLHTAPPLPFPAPERVAPGSGHPLGTAARSILRELAAGPAPVSGLLPGRPLDEVLVELQRLAATGAVELRGGLVSLAQEATGRG